MPFQAKSFDELPKDRDGEFVPPDVQIIFHGQLILRSADGLGCDVMVNPVATRHVLSVEARIKKCGMADRIAMRHLGPLKFRDSEAMLIEVSSTGAEVASGAFKLTGTEAINFGDPESVREDDFRWILDIEGPLFHGRELNFQGFANQDLIRLRGGEYHFKTAARAHPRLQYRRSGGGREEEVVGAIGCVASANVFLHDGESVVMRWRDETRDDERVLTMTKAEDTCYEIYIENTPLFLDKPREAQLPRLDELVHYYKVLDVAPGERFSFVPELNPGVAAGSPDVPCQVLTQNGGS